RHHLLLARRPACVSRHRRPGDAGDRPGARRRRQGWPSTVSAGRRAVAVLALRRRRVDRRVHRCLRHRPLSGTMSREEMTMIEVPAPTAWPVVLAVGFTLIFAGLLLSASVSVL